MGLLFFYSCVTLIPDVFYFSFTQESKGIWKAVDKFLDLIKGVILITIYIFLEKSSTYCSNPI